MQETIRQLIDAKRGIWSDATYTAEKSRLNMLFKYGFPNCTPKELLDRLLPDYTRYSVKQFFIRAAWIDRRLRLNLGYDLFLEDNPEIFRGVYVGRVKVISDDGIKKLLKHPKANWLHNAMILMIYAGLRKLETLKVRWSDIENNYVSIWQGKGRKNRQVPLLPSKQALLKPNNSDWVVDYDDPRDNNLSLRHLMRHHFTKLAKECGVPFTPHDLRAFCIQKVSEVLSQKELQDFAGHASFQTTLKYIVADKAIMLEKLAKLR